MHEEDRLLKFYQWLRFKSKLDEPDYRDEWMKEDIEEYLKESE